MTEANPSGQLVKSRLLAFCTLFFIHHNFSLWNAYINFNLSNNNNYFEISIFYIYIPLVIYLLIIFTTPKRHYESLAYRINNLISFKLSLRLLYLSLIILAFSIWVFIKNFGDPEIRLLLLSSDKFGNFSIIGSVIPLITAFTRMILLILSIFTKDSKKFLIVAFSLVVLELSTLSRAGFFIVAISSVIYISFLRKGPKYLGIFACLFLVMIYVIATAQGRVNVDSSIIELLISPVLSFVRYNAESFALANISHEIVGHVSYWNFFFGFPVIKLNEILQIGDAVWLYNDFRTEFFDIEVLGYSNVVHPFPAMLNATGGLSGLVVGVIFWLLIFIFLNAKNSAIGFLIYFLVFYRGVFGIPHFAWHDPFVIGILIYFLTSRKFAACKQIKK